MLAKGTFEVKVAAVESPEIAKEAGLGAMTIDKVWHGALKATSKGEMLHGSEVATGAMAYVALERVSGELEDKRGTFLLAHMASMLKGDPTSNLLAISVVPHSGTGELTALTGTVKILVDETGGHRYEFEYSFSA